MYVDQLYYTCVLNVCEYIQSTHWLVPGYCLGQIACLERSVAMTAVGEADPPTPMGTGPLSVWRGAEAAQRADRGSTREQFYPASGRTDA